MQKRISRAHLLGVAAAGVMLLIGCKEYLSPHVSPEADAELIVAKTIAAADRSARDAGSQKRVVLTLNNFPEADEPLEQDFVQQLVELFEQRNPDISIQYSPWQYSAESFTERAKNGTLTDVVEVDAAQMPPIIDMNAAADLTENVAMSEQIRAMNPEVFRVVSNEGRTYGVPTELHTMALYFNRKLVEKALRPTVIPAATSSEETSEPKKKSTEKKKGKGADGEPRDYLEAEPLEKEPIVLAQYWPQQQGGGQQQGGYYNYQPREEEGNQQQYSRRGRQEVQDRYNMQPQQQHGTRRSRGTPQQQQPQQGYDPSQQQYQYQQQQQGYGRGQQPMLYAPPEEEEDARMRRRRNRDQALDSAAPGSEGRKRGKSGETTSTEKSDELLNEDVLSTAAEVAAMETTATKNEANITSTIETAGLPKDWDQFIRFAVKLTDHEAGVFGYGPVLFAKEGGREFSQWAVQSGMQIQYFTDGKMQLDLNNPTSAEVAQFLKDLHWRFDVTPPPEKCFHENLLRMFAEGKLGMMMLPADAAVIQRLIKMGMPLDDIGISALPKGPKNGNHLTYGKCLIINSQLDRERRAAAFKWVLFMAAPEIQRLREQFFFREQERTGGPRVPLYVADRQQQLYEDIKPFRMLPFYKDYEANLATRLALEPAYQKDKLYDSIALGVRPVIEHQDSDPVQAVSALGHDFMERYVSGPKGQDNLLQRAMKDMMIY